MDGAFYCLFLLCEDHAAQMEKEDGGRLLEILLPKLLSFYNHQLVEVCCAKLDCD
jgi:hypothetical protein